MPSSSHGSRLGRLLQQECQAATAALAGKGGGGRPDMAQAGGTRPENLASALASVPAWVDGKL